MGKGHPTRGHPRRHSTAVGCQKSDPKPQLPGSPIPPFAHQAGCPQGHHCYGSPPRTTRLSYVEVRSTIRRQRHRLLREPIPPTANPLTTKESDQTRPPDHSSGAILSLFLGRDVKKKLRLDRSGESFSRSSPL